MLLYIVLPLMMTMTMMTMMMVSRSLGDKVGDKLPAIDLLEGDPHTVVNLAELFKKKKGVLFGVPGAFTPDCHRSHLPSYLQNAEAIKQKGVDIIACVSVNDTFVMAAWGKVNNT
uniref:Peroxiredoxin-5, mitochondrial n=1 Tax=Callorhinchus milii TaxID=7868 RepID=A0A4W3GBL1_CALMI